MKLFHKSKKADLTKDLTRLEKARVILGFFKWVVILAVVFFAGTASFEKALNIVSGTRVNFYITHSSTGILSPVAEAIK